MSIPCWVNGEPGETLSILDRGLHYGDGLFETLAVRDGRIQLLEDHLERLSQGCLRLRLAFPPLQQLRGELQVAADDQRSAVLKLILTRGAGARGYRAVTGVGTRIILRYPWPDFPAERKEQGVSLRVCDTRLGHNPVLAGLKHLNRLEQVLARMEWGDDETVQEGLMLDQDGLVVEGTMTNVFAVSADGTLVTPDVSRCGVAGVMRRHLLERARSMGLTVQVTRLTLEELMQAREIFLCNSLIGVWPVACIGERHFSVGPVTRRLGQVTGF